MRTFGLRVVRLQKRDFPTFSERKEARKSDRTRPPHSEIPTPHHQGPHGLLSKGSPKWFDR